MKLSVRKIAFAAVIGAAYAALTMLLAPLSFGPIQLRVSEALCVLPYFFPASAWGLFVGCALSNLMSAAGPMDVIFGSLGTLCAALGTASIGRKGGSRLLAALLPVPVNAIVVGLVLAAVIGGERAFLPTFALFGAEVAAGELIAMLALGLPLLYALPRAPWFQRISQMYRKD